MVLLQLEVKDLENNTKINKHRTYLGPRQVCEYGVHGSVLAKYSKTLNVGNIAEEIC